MIIHTVERSECVGIVRDCLGIPLRVELWRSRNPCHMRAWRRANTSNLEAVQQSHLGHCLRCAFTELAEKARDAAEKGDVAEELRLHQLDKALRPAATAATHNTIRN